MLVGAQLLNGCGAIALCHSLDGVKWSYVGKIASSNLYQMIECPDLFSIDETDVLIFCPQKRDNEHDTSIFSFAAYKMFSIFLWSSQDRTFFYISSTILRNS